MAPSEKGSEPPAYDDVLDSCGLLAYEPTIISEDGPACFVDITFYKHIRKQESGNSHFADESETNHDAVLLPHNPTLHQVVRILSNRAYTSFPHVAREGAPWGLTAQYSQIINGSRIYQSFGVTDFSDESQLTFRSLLNRPGIKLVKLKFCIAPYTESSMYKTEQKAKKSKKHHCIVQ